MMPLMYLPSKTTKCAVQNNDYMIYEQANETWDWEKSCAKRAGKKDVTLAAAKKTIKNIIKNSGMDGRIFWRYKDGYWLGEDIYVKTH